MPTADQIITALNLQPLEGEGGFFRQTWIRPAEDGAPLGTAILYLVTPTEFSSLHRLDADEIFHFYLGDPCEQFVIGPDNQASTTVLGHDLLNGEQVQSVVPAASWQGTKLIEGGSWALVGTTMSPGFHLDGFELATSDDLADMPADVAAIATSYLADGA